MKSVNNNNIIKYAFHGDYIHVVAQDLIINLSNGSQIFQEIGKSCQIQERKPVVIELYGKTKLPSPNLICWLASIYCQTALSKKRVSFVLNNGWNSSDIQLFEVSVQLRGSQTKIFSSFDNAVVWIKSGNKSHTRSL